MTKSLEIDLETYVVDYEEMKSIHVAYMKANLPWIDMPTDFAIRSSAYKIAKKEGIKTILIGHDFRSEGTQPNEWSHGDSRQLRYIVKKFSNNKVKFSSYPVLSTWKMLIYSQLYGIKIRFAWPADTLSSCFWVSESMNVYNRNRMGSNVDGEINSITSPGFISFRTSTTKPFVVCDVTCPA